MVCSVILGPGVLDDNTFQYQDNYHYFVLNDNTLLGFQEVGYQNDESMIYIYIIQ